MTIVLLRHGHHLSNFKMAAMNRSHFNCRSSETIYLTLPPLKRSAWIGRKLTLLTIWRCWRVEGFPDSVTSFGFTELRSPLRGKSPSRSWLFANSPVNCTGLVFSCITEPLLACNFGRLRKRSNQPVSRPLLKNNYLYYTHGTPTVFVCLFVF